MDKDITSEIKRLKSSAEFKAYVKKNPDNYLASCFKMGKDDLELVSWQFDFYSQKSGKITSFRMDKKITMEKDQEVFGKTGHPMRLGLDDVKMDFHEAMSLMQKLVRQNIPTESVNNKIIILQEIEGKTVWNITLFTSAFNVMNVRIDAKSGDILSQKCESILSFKLSR